MNKPTWLGWYVARAAYLRQAAEHGGEAWRYDVIRLHAALAWPQSVSCLKGQISIFELAASYAEGVLIFRPFAGANGRMAWLLCILFLRLNGLIMALPAREGAAMILSLAGRHIDRSALARWLHLAHLAAQHGENRTLVAVRVRDQQVVGMSVLGSAQGIKAGDIPNAIRIATRQAVKAEQISDSNSVFQTGSKRHS